jgi:nicotinate-nucleotide adenylyltransferase
MVGLMRRIGVLGGTFDPPHIGHLILAEYTLEALQLERVLFVPAGEQPFKPHTRSLVNHRLEMLKLVIEDNPDFRISRVDLDRPGPHYTADMLPLIQADFPDAQLWFIMGGDNLRDLPKWKHAAGIYEQARLAVMRRSDENISADMHDDSLHGLSEKVDIVDTPLLSIWLSSTHVVERLQLGKSVRYLVPDIVLDYIKEHNLYTLETE